MPEFEKLAHLLDVDLTSTMAWLEHTQLLHFAALPWQVMENSLAPKQFAALQSHPNFLMVAEGSVEVTPEYGSRIFQLPLVGEEEIPPVL